MTLPMVTCPLCCRPGFSTSDSLCAALVGVTSRKLCCPICNEIVTGLDKFTIHLFSHSLKKFGLQTFKEPIESCQNSKQNQINDNNNNNSMHSITKASKSLPLEEGNKTKQLNNNLIKFQTTVKESVPYKTSDKTEWKINNNNTHFQIENTKNILNTQENPLIYFRTDNGQIFALTQENLGTSLKNVTINTQNYITNTNITTATVQTSVIEKVQKRKYNQITDKEISEICDKGTELLNSDSDLSLNTAGTSVPNNCSLSGVTAENEKKCITREFESCRDLLTKGDFSTSTDDLIEACINKDVASEMELVNDEISVESCLTKKEETKPKDGFPCDICPFVFPNKTILAMHKQLIHKKVEVETENKRKMFVCNLCPKSFKMRGSLMLHRRVAHSSGLGNSENSESSKQPPPKPACQVCGKFFKKEIHLSQHMKAHDEKQWQCTICTKTFTTKYFLKKHRRLHTGEMPYRCTTCSKAFTFQQSYHKHLLYHNDDKPYCCAQCGRLFKELSTLQNHERIHSGEKPFTCETCGKAFRQRVSYLVHRRIHTGAMPYKCTACNKSFRYKVSERTHKCSAQPPGVVVRTQANLVERLQAAMIKAAEKNDKKLLLERKMNNAYSPSVKSPKTTLKNSPQDKSPINSPLSKVPSILETSISNKNIKDKPQYYLLVKGPNDESYYQPVVVPHKIKPVEPKQQEKNDISITDSRKTTSEKDIIEISLQDSESTDKVVKNVANNNSQSFHIVLKSPESFSSSTSNSSSLLDSPVSNNHSVQQEFLYCNFVNSPKEKVSSTSDSEIFTMIVDTNERKQMLPSQSDNDDSTNDRKRTSPINSPPDKSSSCINNDNENYCEYLETTFSEKRKRLDTENNADESKSVHDDGNPDCKKDYSSPPGDILMDSSDIFSLILSPALSSPSDKFGRLTLSPTSTPSTSWNICSFEKQNLLSDNLNSELDMTHDPLFENISDDALKEFLFGSELNK